jgi:putative membrane protein
MIIGSGIILSIVFFSNIVSYFINNYYFVTMMLFIGLIVGGTYNYSRNIKYSLKRYIVIILIIVFMLCISLFNINNVYVIQNNYMDILMFFIGGVIEVFTSIVPGISGTALLMLFGLYDNILVMMGNVFDLSFVMNNIMLYISYGIGMGISFIVCSLFISYLLKKYRNGFDTVVMGFSISSIILLLIMTFKSRVILLELLIGVVLFLTGIVISYLLDR